MRHHWGLAPRHIPVTNLLNRLGGGQKQQPRAGSRQPLSTTASRRTSPLLGISLVIGGAALGIGYATLFPSPLGRILNPPIAPPAPHQDSKEGQAHVAALEKALQSLSQVKALRAEKEPGQSGISSLTPESVLLQQPKWKESRPYQKYPEDRRAHHLTAGVLKGPGKLAVAPLVLSTQDDTESVIFMHLGRSLCGHE